MKIQKYFSLIMWMVALMAIGAFIGLLTTAEIGFWYNNLNRSFLTPPNYVFSIVWTILYALIGASGWLIWSSNFLDRKNLKILYCMQLVLNWSWTFFFFKYHLIGAAFIILCAIDFLVAMIIWLSYSKIKSVSFFMIPYAVWILFASYLNYYIWLCN